ncbi:hypothetical protein HDR59_04260 [bacterium]|nr:hypothetical protein [bacterium]
MADIFEKGIENLDNRDPVIVLCGEVGSMVGRFVDGDVSESETTKKLIDIYHTKFDGKAEEFEEILKFMKSLAEVLPERVNNGNVKLDKDDLKLKNILNRLMTSLEVDDVEHIYDEFLSASFSAVTVGMIEEEAPRHSMTINEVINPTKMNVNETVNEDEKVDEKTASHHPLWYVINNVDESQSENVDVENDVESSDVEKVDFFGKEVSVGDKTKINFVDEKKKKSSVSMGADTNSINIAHDKKTNVSRAALNTTFKGVLDYMSANEEVPFDFVINTKTADFKKEFIGSIIAHSMKDRMKDTIKDNSLINGVSKEPLLAGKISSFVINGMNISYDDFSKFSSYEDFEKFEEKMNKDKGNVRKKLLENGMVNNSGR